MGKKIVRLLKQNGLPSKSVKGKFDHGVFVPLMIMYPDASIPVIQISLKKGLDVAEHIALGNALSSLEDVLFVASGSSFHNLRAFFSNERYDHQRNEKFHDALKHLMTADMLEESRVQKMIHYQQLPHSSFVHPRSEHLIPLFVAYGIAQKKGMVQFEDLIMGKRCICFEWEM